VGAPEFDGGDRAEGSGQPALGGQLIGMTEEQAWAESPPVLPGADAEPRPVGYGSLASSTHGQGHWYEGPERDMDMEEDDDPIDLSLFTPEEREMIPLVQEEEKAAPKLVATRVEVLVGEMMVIPVEMEVLIGFEMKAGDTVTANGTVLVTMEEKSGKRAMLLIEASRSGRPRKLPARAGEEGTVSGDHRTLQAGETMLFAIEEPERLTRDMLAGETLTVRRNVLISMEGKSGRRARFAFETPGSCEIVKLLMV
jgi:hypothetical protein